jgi:hypothetical protein
MEKQREHDSCRLRVFKAYFVTGTYEHKLNLVYGAPARENIFGRDTFLLRRRQLKASRATS